jgi:AAA domain
MSNTQRMFIVVSGIPGSGKTTVGQKIAAKLILSYYDKDEILEGLFESLGTGDATWRKKLSRASDEILIRLATHSAGAVVTSFWRNQKTFPDSGTPVDWLWGLSEKVLEIYCFCEPELAATRFKNRKRHQGHLDENKQFDDLLVNFHTLSEAGPLGLGEVIVVNTGNDYDLDSIVNTIRAKLETSFIQLPNP